MKRTSCDNPDSDTRTLLKPTHKATILSPLSAQVQQLLPNDDHLVESIINLLAQAEVVYQGRFSFSTMIFRVSEDVVVKLYRKADDTDGYSALEYLQDHLPSFPIPRPHGLIKISYCYLSFMTYIPGTSLDKAWSKLDVAQKNCISSQLDKLFSELRSLPCPENQPLGGLQGQGCKDVRRFMRESTKPIMNVDEFEDFIFSLAKYTTPFFERFLRDICPQSANKVVFTHGNVGPSKIMVDTNDTTGEWKVVGIVGWELAGFYTEYWESVKITEALFPMESRDWFNYLPECLHPRRYPERWLLDKVWDRHVELC